MGDGPIVDLTNGQAPAAPAAAPVAAEPAPAPAPAAAPAEAAPAAAAPAYAPAPSLASTAAVAPPSDAPPAKPADAPVADAPPAAPETQPPAAAEAKPADAPVVDPAAPKPAEPPATDPAKPEEPPKPADAAPAVDPAAAPADASPAVQPVEYKYDLGDRLVLPDDQKAAFHSVLDTYRADPSNVQPLIDYHLQRMGELQTQALQHQIDTFQETVQGWQKLAMADEQVGGARHETAMNNVALARDTFVSRHAHGTDAWKKDLTEFNQLLDYTGLGNHPVFLRFMDNAAAYVREPEAPALNNVNIPTPRPNGQSPLYDNPRSQQRNGR